MHLKQKFYVDSWSVPTETQIKQKTHVSGKNLTKILYCAYFKICIATEDRLSSRFSFIFSFVYLFLKMVRLLILSILMLHELITKYVAFQDEVAFVQNLVYYVERAYRTPDYGMWERGTKYNDGTPEIHASSIGMAKAALEAINGCNLFGEKGASWSVVYVDIDAHNRNRSIFETLLPRASSSKVNNGK